MQVLWSLLEKVSQAFLLVTTLFLFIFLVSMPPFDDALQAVAFVHFITTNINHTFLFSLCQSVASANSVCILVALISAVLSGPHKARGLCQMALLGLLATE